MAFIAVEAVPPGSKPPAAVGVRISTGKRHDFGGSAPLSTKPSSLYIRRAGGSAILLKLAKLVGPSTVLAEELFPRFARSSAAFSVRLRVFSSVFTSASIVRRGY